MKILVLVESPAKVKKIGSILNSQRDGNQYIVAATVGHILDLNKNKTLGVDLKNNYQPDYVEHPKKGDVIANLKKIKKNCHQVWIASDLDQEGEFIGYSICHILKLGIAETPRIVFNEITKDAILKAVKKPSSLNFDLLDAQKCRRITDRLIGFLITRAAKSINDKLTVGRVQTIMVKLVIDREEEIQKFKKTLAFHTTGLFDSEFGLLDSKLNKTFNSTEEIQKTMELIKESKFMIDNISDRTVKKNPPPPLITSTLQSLVSRSLGISPKKVLEVAQKLYQQGVISYPRTDCPRLPEEKMGECEKFIKDKYGDEFFESRVFQNKDASAQEAHACIYPTRIEIDCLEDDEDMTWNNWEKKVYGYIWLYTISSQMSPSETKNTKGKIVGDQMPENLYFTADHSQLIFEGYLKAWGKIAVAEEDEESNGDQPNDENKNSALLKLKDGDQVTPEQVETQQKLSSGPTPYTESALLTQMKKLGIGRPSTYGGILADIQSENKQFIYRGNKSGEKVEIQVMKWKPATSPEILLTTKEVKANAHRNRLYSTDQGRAINNFVNEYFSNVFNYHFTRDLENQMKQIENGKTTWQSVVDNLYQEFAPKLKQFPYYRTKEDGPNPARKPKRQVGQYQGQPVFTYLAKYGPVIQVGEDENPKFIGLPKEYHVDTVEFSQIEYLLMFPLNLGKMKDGRPAVVKISNHGLYIDTEGSMGKFPRKNKSRRKTYHLLPEMFDDFNDEQPMLEQIKKLNLDKITDHVEQTEKPKDVLRKVGDIDIVNGKFGPYFIFNKVLVGIPKFHNVDLITYDECLDLYKSKSNKKFGGKKGTKKFTLKKKLSLR